MTTELERQKGLIIMKRRSLAEYVVAKRHPTLSDIDDLSSTLQREDLIDNQIKQMINKENKKRLFIILCRDIKVTVNPASIIKSPMARIDVTLEYETIISKTKKE
jgi:hypothetical protein